MANAKEVKIDDIAVDLSIIGRGGLNEDAVIIYMELMEKGWKKPVILQKDSMKLIDGAHRIEAAKRLDEEKKRPNGGKILATFKDINDCDLRLHAFLCNQKHGVQYTKKERNQIIVNLYNLDGKTQKEIADVFGLGRQTITDIISNAGTGNTNKTADKRRELTKDEERTIGLLAVKGEKQKDLVERFKITQGRVSQIKTDYVAELRQRYSDGEGRMNIITDTGLDSSQLDSLLVSATDKDPLDFELPITTWWEYYGLDERQGKCKGAVPVQLVKNLLAAFTKPGDHIVDPFAGGGVTKIACNDMVNRTCELFDLTPIGKEIKQFSIINDELEVFLPQVEKKPDFLFLDPPYGSQKKGEYSKDKRDLSNLEIPDYIMVLKSFFEAVAAKDEWKPVKIALLMSSQREKNKITDLPSIFSESLKNSDYIIRDHIVNRIKQLDDIEDAEVELAKKNRWLIQVHTHILVAESGKKKA